jgi:hypothetical protein
MLSGTRALAALVFVPAFAVSACGGESPSGPTYSQTSVVVLGSGFGGAATACEEFNNAKAGPVSVFVTPPSIHLVLRAGTCNAPGQLVAEKDTELVNVNAPAGSNHVRLSNPNPSGPDTPFTLRLTYWR